MKSKHYLTTAAALALLLAAAPLLRAADSVVVFNEIHYHPADELNDSEWVELHNLMGVNVDVSNWELKGGINYAFPEGTVVPGHGFVVVAADPAHPSLASLSALGPFTGRLENRGERVRLVNNNDRTMDEVSYGDDRDWPVGPDGMGTTLSKLNEESAEARPSNWVSSVEIGGTPGASNFPRGVQFTRDLVFNEIAAAGDPNFRLELTVVGEESLDLTGYELRSSAGESQTLPAGSLEPGDYVVITPGFAVSEGDRLAVFRTGGTELADAREVTGRLRGLAGDQWLYPEAPSFGGANVFDFETGVVINEIMYNHHPAQEPFRRSDEQWIELFNRGASEVDLSGWRFSDGVAFEFPAGTMMAPGDYLVVARDAAALAAKFPAVTIAGQWTGSLSRKGERLRLIDTNRNPVDEVRFADGGRWPSKADGGGSSLELRDPDADNSSAEAWAASVESGPWQTISYNGRATNLPSNDPTLYNEFIFGLLDAGEFLIDDISVIEDPTGVPRELIQNGNFSSGTAARWRMRGNHRHAEVVEDPDDPGNQVLHVRATGAMEHMHNHAETTLKDGASFITISSTKAYRITFRAKWLSGSNQLNSRLYFNRLPKTTILEAPEDGGTPGAPNSQLVDNAGPTYAKLTHSPAVPRPGRGATVSVTAHDPDGVSSLALFYVVDGGIVRTTPMVDEGGGRFTGEVPRQIEGAKAQYYIEARDSLGAIEFFPAAGPDSRAIIPWFDGQADLDYGSCQPNNFRIVMTDDDTNFMHTVTEVMSNDRLGCTVIYNESEIYYDCGVRLKGSQRGRARDVRVGFNVSFPDDRPFLGAHETVAVDRSGAGDQFSQKEMLVKHIVNHAGGIPGMEDDLIRVIAPRSNHTGSAMLLKSRFDDEWLENQFPNGDDGTMFEYELIYYPTSTTGGPEGDKRPNPDSVAGVSMRALSARRDKELYRYHWQIDNNKDADNYDSLIEMLIAMGRSGTAYRDETNRVLDVDQWLRAFAVQILCGIGDNYSSGSQHNAVFYFRADDGKAMYFPWDMDFSFSSSATGSLTPNSDLSQLLNASPANKRAYYGHLQDIISTTYNTDYMTEWANHYSCFLPTENLAGFLSYINTRRSHALSVINSAVTRVAYRITTPDGTAVPSSFVTLEGDGWIDLRELRLAGSSTPLPITWTDDNSWQVTVPVNPGPNLITLEAIGFQGQLLESRSVNITGTGDLVPATGETLAISELMYHPAAPSIEEQNAGFVDQDDFEFVELQNTSATATLDLTGLAFVNGIVFELPSTTLGPGERAILAGNEDAFVMRYGADLPVIAQFQAGEANKFSNSGERVVLYDAAGLPITEFSYGDGDPWPSSADGDGYSLVLMCPGRNDPADPQSWRTSAALGGNPGTGDAIDLATWMAANGVGDLFEDTDGDRLAALFEFGSGRNPNQPDASALARVAQEEVSGQIRPVIVFRQLIGADEIVLGAQGSANLVDWAAGPTYLGRINNGDGTSSVRFAGALPVTATPQDFLRLEATSKP